MRAVPDEREPTDRDKLYEERVPIVRWSRLGVGFGMILLAIVLIVLENRFGLGAATRNAGPSAVAVTPLPAMATPLAVDGLIVEPRYVGRRNTIGSLNAQSGSMLLMIAVRVRNAGSRPVAVAPTAFRVERSGANLATGKPYPDHRDTLLAPHLAPGATIEGIVVFALPATASSTELRFESSSSTAMGAWQLP